MGRHAASGYEDTYFFRGSYLTIKELMPYSQGISQNTVVSRLRSGWDTEAALKAQNKEGELDPKWHGKNLLIEFRVPVGCVKSDMQPTLYKPYVAYANKHIGSKQSAKCFFVVKLENGKRLIVYPNEFQILGEAPSA